LLQGGDYGDFVEKVELPDKVIIPLKQGFSAETDCLVIKGERVRAGQIIGRDDHTWSSPVHSSINGVVEHFATFTEGAEPHYGVLIRRDHSDERGYTPLPGAGSADKSPYEIGDLLYLAGVTALGSSGIPSSHHTSDLDLKDVKSLVVNGLSGEPFSLPQEQLLYGREKEFMTGLSLLMKLLGLEDDVHIVLKKGARKDLNAEALPGGAKLHFVKNRYPFDMAEIVTEIATGLPVPDGGTPSEVGAVVVTVQDVIHVYEAVVLGKPLIERIVAVGGPGIARPRLMKVPVGTPMEWLLVGNMKGSAQPRILAGGGMRGRPIESVGHPVDRSFSALTVLEENTERDLLSFMAPGLSALSTSRAYLSNFFTRRTRKAETNLQGERRPCIYCSYCEDLCPRGLVPHIYSRQVSHDMAEDALKFGIEACIECGLCSFACPSKLPLLEDIRKGKALIESNGIWSHPTGLKKLEGEGKI